MEDLPITQKVNIEIVNCENINNENAKRCSRKI